MSMKSPLAGSDEFLVHYDADITERSSERLLPELCNAAADYAACSWG